jgi:6-phosphogluconolactonase
MTTEVFVVRDAALLSAAVAARLVTRLVDRQAASGGARLLLGGDEAAAAVLAALAASPARDAVDLARLELWQADAVWSGDPAPAAPDARRGLPGVDWHAVPTGPDVAECAQRYASELAAARRPEDHGPVPTFDIAMLGLHPSGGVAGIDPESPAVHDERPVVVSGPPELPRVTLGLSALAQCSEVWLLGSGAAVAASAHLVLTGAGVLQVPAVAAVGRQRTLMFLDEPAASRLPTALRRIASP